MKRLLLTMVLLSTAFSDNSFDRQEGPSRIVEKQFWPGKETWFARDNVRPELDELLGYDVDKFPRNLGSRVFAKPVKLPPTAVIRRLNTGTGHMRNEPSEPIGLGDVEFRVVSPTIVMLSIDFNDQSDEESLPPARCTSKKCRRRSQGWELQKPFYVQEPRWIEINKDFVDTLSDQLEPTDPFVLSRGKKIIRLKDTDYDDVAEIQENPRTLRINRSLRSRRSLGSSKFEDKRNDQEETDTKRKESERKTSESRRRSNYFGNLRNSDQSEDPFILTRGKKMRMQEQEYSDNYLDGEKDRSLMMKEFARGKRSLETFSQEGKNSEGTSGSKNLTDSEVPTSTSIDPEISFAGTIKTVSETDHSDTLKNFKKATGKSVNIKETEIPVLNEVSNDMAQKERDSISRYSREKRSNRRDSGPTDGSEVETNASIEENISDGYYQWLKDTQKRFGDPTYVERRDKHSDIMDLLEQPYFISRGKKKVELNDRSYLKRRQEEAEYSSPMKSLAVRRILDRLADSLKCTSGECANDVNKIVKRKPPRDRRGALDELLAKYDPYYVARGKRTEYSPINSRLEQNRGTEFGSKTLSTSMR